MADIVDKATRSRVMSRIRKKWTSQERRLHGILKSRKVRHRMYPKLAGSPDALICPRTVVFLDGCFWHGCPPCYVPPKSRVDYWHPKIDGNKRRDCRTRRLLRAQGWVVVQFWEHQFRQYPERCCSEFSPWNRLFRALNRISTRCRLSGPVRRGAAGTRPRADAPQSAAPARSVLWRKSRSGNEGR